MIGPQREDAPLVLREQRSVWALALPAGLLFSALKLATALRPELLGAGLPATAASLFTVAVTVCAVATFAISAWWAAINHGTEPYPPDSPAVAIGIALSLSLTFGLGLRSSLGLSREACAAWTVIGILASFSAVRERNAERRGARSRRLIMLGDPAATEELIAECRAELGDPGLASEARNAASLSVATGLADLAIVADRYEGLPEALEIMRDAVDRRVTAWTVVAAFSLGPAMTNKAQRTGDADGLAETMELLAVTIREAPPMLTWVHRALLVSRAHGLVALASSADADGDTAGRGVIRAGAARDLERAIGLCRRGSARRAELVIELATISWTSGPGGGLDDAIERCRRALRSLRRRPGYPIDDGCLALAELLVERADDDDDDDDDGRGWQPREPGRTADLKEALALCELVGEKGRAPHRGLCALPARHDALGADESVVAGAFRRAFDATAAVSIDGAIELAAGWASWAAMRFRTDEAAEAHWSLIRAVAAGSHRRLRSADDFDLPDAPTLAAEAGFWLLAADRPCDAAVALDLGRAVQLHQRLGGPGKGIDERLVDADRFDLDARWSALDGGSAGRRRTDDARGHRQSEPSAIRIGRHRFEDRLAADDGSALADHERLLREIGRLPAFADVLVAPTYEDLREAASDGPIVYVAATDDGGFAIIVSEGSPEPETVVLPGLSRPELERRARELVGAFDSPRLAEALEETLGWLGRRAITPVTKLVPPAALVTLVPLGALSALPLHAAGMRRRSYGGWSDGTGGLVFRYAAHARALLRARATAQSIGGPGLPVVTVAVPDTPGCGSLEYAAQESRAVAAQFGDPDRVRRPVDGSADALLGALEETAVVHLACHAELDPAELLASCLRMSDRPLTAGELLAGEAVRHRLAVLSACRTKTTGEPKIDELASLPDLLIASGVAGVVSSPTVASRQAAMLLVLRFFEEFLDGVEPARALAAAQGWLASATNREIDEAFEGFQRQPAAVGDDERPFADPACWAVFSYSGS